MFRNATHAFMYGVKTILESGDSVTVRDMKTKELLHQQIQIQRPCERCIVVPRRNGSIFATIAETLWMLSGRDDIEWLSFYLPRATDFSDDGAHWRGAYGPRIRRWKFGSLDQLAYVVKLLQKDPSSRQAVMSIWDPEVDTQPGKDSPV